MVTIKSSQSTHTDPPAARAVRSSSRRSPSFPVLVRVPCTAARPETNSLSSDLWELMIRRLKTGYIWFWDHKKSGEQKISKKKLTYIEWVMLRLTSSVTKLVREIWLLGLIFIAGSDSAETTLSNIKATACLNVAAAVLRQNR